MRSAVARPVVFGWGVAAVSIGVGSAAARLGLRGIAAWPHATAAEQAAAGAWIAWMLLTAGWFGFHRQFAPRVAVRAARLAGEPPSALDAVAPLVAIGLVRTTPRRRAITLGIGAGVVAMTAAAHQLGPVGRGLVDLGVGAALVSGTLSVAWFAVRTATGHAPPIDPDWPVTARPRG